MDTFATLPFPVEPTNVAPDGSNVRALLSVAAGGIAHFELGAGKTSVAVTHRTVEEIWFVVSGHGEMWRKHGAHEEIVTLEPGLCLTIPVGTHFQFRAFDTQALSVVACTMPPWPGKGEAITVSGPWQATE